MCPTDPRNPKTTNQGFHGNYVVCHGSTSTGGAGVPTLNGMFYYRSRVKLGDVIDGLTNTIMAGEVKLQTDGTTASGTGNVVCNSPHDLRGRYYNPYHGNLSFTTLQPPNPPVGDIAQYCAGTDLVPCWTCRTNNQEIYSRSYHAGGVQFLLGDGSVRFISDNVDTVTFRALGTREGQEPLGDF
jgi:prepilin-type processing-associated H-X9-DG protein